MDYDNKDALDRPAGLVIAPNGKRIAYHVRTRARVEATEGAEPTETKWKYTSSIWVARVGKKNSVRRITDGTTDDYMPKWSTNGALIAFLSNCDRQQNDEQESKMRGRYGSHEARETRETQVPKMEEKEKYRLYRYWFGVDEQPVPFLSFSLQHTRQFAFSIGQPDSVLHFQEYYGGPSQWDQRFADFRLLSEVSGRMHDCAIWGSGHVVAVATRAVRVGRSHVPVSPSESRNRDAAIVTRRTNYDRDDPASPRSYDYHVWLGGDRRHPQCITVETQPSNSQAYREPLPFPVADLAWAGTTLYILEGGGRSVIYRLDYLSTFNYSYTEVYGAGDDDGHVVGISGMSDDLLVLTRNEEGDRLHLMLSGRTIWQQRDAILEAVAVKYKKPDRRDDKSDKAAETYHKVLMVAMVLADGRVLSVKVPDKIKDKDADEPSDMVAAETTDKKESTGNPRAAVLGEHSRSIVQRSEPLN